MIRDIAGLLQGLIEEETKKLDEFDLSHGPTIGKMYEGLASDILDRAIPPNINLKLVQGFIHDGLGKTTGEIDCMLVEGEGEEIPYTASYKWHVKDVIAVFEVKKTLYSAQLQDSFSHLRGVLDSYGSYVESEEGEGAIDVSSALRAYAEATGKFAPHREDIETLPFELQIIYHTLITEMISPIRIVLGYHGFCSENGLRNAMITFLEENKNTKGFGVGSFPQLIISGEYSLVKLNGQPYTALRTSDYWDFYASSRTSPILLILEFIWTRLSRNHGISVRWGEDLTIENFALLLSGKAIKTGETLGWNYKYLNAKSEILSAQPADVDWEPTYVTCTQFSVFNNLCNGVIEKIDDPEFITYLKDKEIDPDLFFKELAMTGLIAIDDNQLKLTTDCLQCAILPNGKYAVAENNSGRFTNWINKLFNEKKLRTAQK